MDSLSIGAIFERESETLSRLPDHRTGQNTSYGIRDAAACALLEEQKMNYILVSHPTLYKEVALLERVGGVETATYRHWNGRTYRLCWSPLTCWPF